MRDTTLAQPAVGETAARSAAGRNDSVVPRRYLVPFVLLTRLFAIRGLGDDTKIADSGLI